MADTEANRVEIDDVLAEYGSINADLAGKLAIARATITKHGRLIAAQQRRIDELEAAATNDVGPSEATLGEGPPDFG